MENGTNQHFGKLRDGQALFLRGDQMAFFARRIAYVLRPHEFIKAIAQRRNFVVISNWAGNGFVIFKRCLEILNLREIIFKVHISSIYKHTNMPCFIEIGSWSDVKSSLVEDEYLQFEQTSVDWSWPPNRSTTIFGWEGNSCKCENY